MEDDKGGQLKFLVIQKLMRAVVLYSTLPLFFKTLLSATSTSVLHPGPCGSITSLSMYIFSRHSCLYALLFAVYVVYLNTI